MRKKEVLDFRDMQDGVRIVRDLTACRAYVGYVGVKSG